MSKKETALQEDLPATEEEESSDKKKRAALFARRSGKAISRSRLLAKGAFLTAGGLVLLMAILFAASALLDFEGAFTIRAVHPVVENKALSLSETKGFANPTVELSAKAIDGMDNITYDWLPLDELDSVDGTHNGENYIAYSFYLQNSGKETMDYTTSLVITKCTLGVEKAVRVMFYRNGEPTVYAAAREDGSAETVPEGVVSFLGADTVFRETRSGMATGDIDHYTVVVWLEGEDAECINDVRGGSMKMELLVDIVGAEEDSEEENAIEGPTE